MDMRAFCTPNNIDSCSNHVNIQLTAQGYPVPLVFNSVTVEDTCRMINCIHALLSDKKSQEEMIFELNKSILDKKRAYESLSLKFEQQKKATEKEKKEKEHLALKIESMTMTIKTEKDHHRSIKDELTRAKNNLQYIKAQYSHETRRHEQEHAKTRDRLMKLMKNMSRPVMTISQPLVAIKPSSPDILTQGKALYGDLMDKISQRETEARVENEAFRKAFIAVYSALKSLLNRQIEDYEDRNTSTESSRRDIATFQLPFSFGGEEAIQHIHSLLARLQEEWDEQTRDKTVYTAEDVLKRDRVIREMEQDIGTFTTMLDESRREYEEKTKIYRKYEQGGFFDSLLPNISTQLSDSEGSAWRDQKRVTEAAIQLGNERKALSAERWAFEKMKIELGAQEFLSDSPSNPQAEAEGETGPKHEHEHAPSTFSMTPMSLPRKRPRSWLGKAPC
ncbi:Afadin and alpha-actinin-binding-domain-containing protein [Spinellus fusiger]|nr:Afadin and alpha-actinin-binding-domain-containing protein [Spinellus fusiger]